MRSGLPTAAFVAGLVLCHATVLAADEPKAAFAMSIDEFCRLGKEDQRALLVSAFEHRLQHAKNIHYEALMLVSISEYADGRVGAVIQRLNGSRLRHWRLGSSFRADTDRGGPDVSVPVKRVATNYDAETGVSTGTSHLVESGKSFGRIDTIHDQINEFDRYAYWLDGKHTPHGDCIFRYFVEHQAEFKITAPVDESFVRLELPWYPSGGTELRGTREYLLVPDKGFLPIRGLSYWKQHNRSGVESWRREEMFVSESKLVGDVWMPIQLTDVIGGSAFDDDAKVNVWEVTVSEIEAGRVTRADLEIPFEPGMEVVDAIRGESYVVGPGGERTHVERLVGNPQSAAPPAPVGGAPGPPRGRITTVLFVNAVLAVAAVAFFVWQRMRRRS